MKQILQNLKTGKTDLVEAPVPGQEPGHLLILTRVSLIFAGTEPMLVDFEKAGWSDKARQQPDEVWQVLDKVGTDRLVPTLEACKSALDQAGRVWERS